MASIQLESLSTFGRLAVKLDTDFNELVRLSGQLQRLDIESDSGLDKAFKLLDQFTEQGKSISEGIQAFSRALQEAQMQSEGAAKQVADRAQLIAQRKKQQNEMRRQLTQVEEEVAAANAGLGGFKKDGRSEFSAEEKAQIKSQLELLNKDLKRFLMNAQIIKETASQANFKSIENDAQALLDALRSSTRKVDKALTEK